MTTPTPPSSPIGFDAFFSEITQSKEFQDLKNSGNDISSLSDLEKSLTDMQSGVEKAANMMKEYDTKFTPLPSSSSKDSGTVAPKTGNAKDEEVKSAIEVQHFTRVEGKPFGFDAVAGMDQLKEELKDSFIKPLRFKFLVEKLKREDAENPKTEEEKKKHEMTLKLYTEYEKFKISIPTGMLFYGPPGTGKTFITKKLAEELGCGFISKNMGEFGSSYLHQTTKNIADFFDGAKKAAESEPIILFLDEIDSLVSARTNNVDANKAEEVSQFLQEFNGLESAPNLIVIAATNRPDHLDSAILRSGRLDKKIYLGPPDAVARKALFQMYIERAGRPSTGLDYNELAHLTDGYVSADIEAICDEVARDASRDLLELIDEAEDGTLTDADLAGYTITMKSIKETLAETPSSLRMVDMSVYTSWLEKMK
ncbi:AAA family ATPase [Candidatus Gracilibacteria bacterium]|nr:AAA family ATPase [Candidatus Gracilibacteria bacterium]